MRRVNWSRVPTGVLIAALCVQNALAQRAFTWQEIERRPVGPVQDHLDEDGMASKGDDEFWDDDDYDYLFSHTVENPGECTPSI